MANGTRPGEGEREYERRVVAFLDVLGFSQLVEQADQVEERRESILTIISTLRETLARNPRVGFEFTQFSDSIVISAGLNLYGINAVFSGCRMLAVNLIQRGILLRGGIAVGNLTHTDDVLFGTGLLKAYGCDASGAPPRIALHSTMKDAVDDYSAMYGLSEQVIRDHYDLTPMLDTFLDFAEYDPRPAAGKVVLDGPARTIAGYIDASAFNRDLPASVRAKWRWMRDYWNRSVKRGGYLQQAKVDEED